MIEFRRLVSTVNDISNDKVSDLREVRLLRAVERTLAGDELRTTASQFHLRFQSLEEKAVEVRHAGLSALFPIRELTPQDELDRRRQGIAQMLLGVLAEVRFEELTHSISRSELSIEDHRPSRSDTDYRLLNGGGHPVCRFNIKFHGTLFRAAKGYVGLEPEDCLHFSLSTELTPVREFLEAMVRESPQKFAVRLDRGEYY